MNPGLRFLKRLEKRVASAEPAIAGFQKPLPFRRIESLVDTCENSNQLVFLDDQDASLPAVHSRHANMLKGNANSKIYCSPGDRQLLPSIPPGRRKLFK